MSNQPILRISGVRTTFAQPDVFANIPQEITKIQQGSDLCTSIVDATSDLADLYSTCGGLSRV
jgi:hypothetical protein